MKLQLSIPKILLASSCIGLSLNAFPQTSKKNLLFIMTDQQSYDALGFAGNPILKTPNLDRLASQGAYFRNAYTPCAVCGPARSSILTGHTVENTGMKNNDAYFDVDASLMAMPTFDEILTQNGYHCEYYGKWHTSSHRAADIYRNPVQFAKSGRWIFGGGGSGHMYSDYLNENATKPTLQDGQFIDLISKFPYVADPIDRYYGMTMDQLIAQNLKHIQPDQHGKLLIDKQHTLTAFQARQALEAIERLKNTTFSITLSFHFPHSPIVVAEPYYSMYPVENMPLPVSISDNMENSPYKNSNGRQARKEYADAEKIKYMISNYYGLITEIDDWVGVILDKLDELGLAENTMVIFMSDHGEMLGAHGMREKNVFYEESAHIPLLIRFPGEIEAGSTVNGYVSLIDLFPTILDYLNISEHKSDGVSLRGLIEGTDTDHGQYVVTEWDFNGDTSPNFMIVKDGWKMIIPYSKSSTVLNALYDLNTDPYEMNNLIGNNPQSENYRAKTEELRACLLEWLAKNNSKHYGGVNARVLVGTQIVSKASFVSQEVPTSLKPGETVTVSVTMRNTGESTWTSTDNYMLGYVNSSDNNVWGIHRVKLDLGEQIAPNASKTFVFNITAPVNAGRFNFQWRMMEENVEWFGNASNGINISVGDMGSYLDDCDNLTDWKSGQKLTLNSIDHRQGAACIEYTGNTTEEYKKVFSTPFNSRTTIENGTIEFWYYVSNPSALSDKNQVEIGSAGKNDADELNWSLRNLVQGWNFISLNFKDAGKIGNPNPGAINWFRIYNQKSGTVTTRIDAIRILDGSSTTNIAFTQQQRQKIKIYPNPLNSDVLHLKLTGFDFSDYPQIFITNLQGQIVFKQLIHGHDYFEINTKGILSSGIYLLTVHSKNALLTEKLIVNN
jgi:arylsulfatase A-like enzyme